MEDKINKISYMRLFADILIILFSFYVGSYLSQRGIEKVDRIIIITLVVAWYFSAKMSNLYDDFRTEKYVGELLLLFQNIIVQAIVAGQLYFLLNQHMYSRTFVAYYIVLLLVFLTLKSYLVKKILIYYRSKGGNTRNVVFVGFNEITESLIRQIIQSPHYGFKVLGVIAKEEVEVQGYSYLGDLDKFFKNNNGIKVDELIITTDRLDRDMLKRIFLYSESKAIRTKIVPNYVDYYQSRLQFQMFGNYPMITLRSEPLQEYHWKVVKRVFDIIFSILVFIFLFSWLFPIIALIIKLESKGPVFFKQDRWGRNGQKFKCYKFRSMRPESKDVNDKDEFQQAKKNDPRITRVGAFLRKSSIDELPQFINVLLGEMSVVGPRPHAHEHNLRTQDKVESYLVRHWVKPGITGWAQVNGFRGETKTLDEMQKRVEFDIWYIENYTFWLDIRIIFMTIYNALKGEENAY